MFTSDVDVKSHRDRIATDTASRHASPVPCPGYCLHTACANVRTLDAWRRDPERTGAPRHAVIVPTPRDAWADDPDRTTRRDTYAY